MASLVLICQLFSYNPIVFDSTIYLVDIVNMQVAMVKLNDEVIDYTIDNFLYVLTKRYLYKIDNTNLNIIERIPLPERFNYLTVGPDEIILLATEEIITLNKNNLSFKSGIGIEPGDYKPILSPLDLKPLNKSNLIYLSVDIGSKSMIKIFDLNTGRLVRKAQVPRIIYHEFDRSSNSFSCLDIDNQISTYSLNLKIKKQIKIMMSGELFADYPKGVGYIIYNQQGLFWIDNNGLLRDFQPAYAKNSNAFSNYVFLTESGLLYVDPLTLRIKWLRSDLKEISMVTPLDDVSNVGFTKSNSIYLIGKDSAAVVPLSAFQVIPEKRIAMNSSGDSLWYLQFAAFSGLANARAFGDSLNNEGLPVIVDSTDLYRVKLGGFFDNDVGLELLERSNLNGWLVYQEKIANNEMREFSIGNQKYILVNGYIKKE